MSRQSAEFSLRLNTYEKVTFLKIYTLYLIPITIFFGGAFILMEITGKIELTGSAAFISLLPLVSTATRLIILWSARRDILSFNPKCLTKLKILPIITFAFVILYAIWYGAVTTKKNHSLELAYVRDMMRSSATYLFIFLYFRKRKYIFTDVSAENMFREQDISED